MSNLLCWSNCALEVWIECNVKWDSCLWRGSLSWILGSVNSHSCGRQLSVMSKPAWRRMACIVKSAFEWKTTRSLNLKETPTETSIRCARVGTTSSRCRFSKCQIHSVQQTMAQRSHLHYPSKLGADNMIPNVDPKVNRTQTMKQALSMTIAANFHSFFTSFSSSSLRNLAVILRISFRMQTMS